MSVEVELMKASFYQEQVEKLLKMVADQKGDEAESSAAMSAAELIDPHMLAQEHQLFKSLPLVVAHQSEVANPGDFVIKQLQGRSWLIVRGKDGAVRAFLNYCQHRGTRLVHQDSGCQSRFVCPYHAWTYNTQGDLLGVPRSDLFPGLDKSQKGLRSAKSTQEAFGFIWLQQEGDQVIEVEAYLQSLVPELEALNLGDFHLFFDKTRELNANWKLPIYAFLEGYHISSLHKDSIADFFVENVAHSESHGPHIRSFVPRKTAVGLGDVDLDEIRLAEYITPTNILFPNLCMIGHPNAYTIITLMPGANAGESSWRHMLLVPKQPSSEQEQRHYEKTVEVLDGKTYEAEDFWASEMIQEGVNAGAIDEMLLSKNEMMIKHFADTVKSYL